MVYFGKYLKDYLEYKNISQSEFATRMNVTQKHMNEILNGKSNISLEMAINIERLTNIDAKFIMKVENERIISEKLLHKYRTENRIYEMLKQNFYIDTLENIGWIVFNDRLNPFQVAIDLLNFLKIKEFEVLDKLQSKTLFKKEENNFNKISLWIARCDNLADKQMVKQYNNKNINIIIDKIKSIAYLDDFNEEKIKKILNDYGIYFVKEKTLKNTNINGCFKVKGKNPAIYLNNHDSKYQSFFSLLHEISHIKSDYNCGKNKVIIEGNALQEKRADEFAVNNIIDSKVWEKILEDISEKNITMISKKNKIPMTFIVNRLLEEKIINKKNDMYVKYNI